MHVDSAAMIDAATRRRIQAYRVEQIGRRLNQADCAAIVLFDPLNIRYATGTRNMQVRAMHNIFRYAVRIMRDGLANYGPRGLSSMVVRRLEDACHQDLRAPGFPEFLTDDEPEATGAEILPRQADRQAMHRGCSPGEVCPAAPRRCRPDR